MFLRFRPRAAPAAFAVLFHGMGLCVAAGNVASAGEARQLARATP